MKLMFIFAGAFLFNSIQSHDSGSFESSNNGIELSPFYDTIIFSDIADIIKEFESSDMPIIDKLVKDDSESDENVEDLLQEYQKYLDKEQKQRKEYMERTKLKNKVPLLRHERYTKKNLGNSGKYNDYIYKNGYYNKDTYKSTNPLDLLIPINPKGNHLNTKELTTTLPRDSMEFNIFPRFPFKAPCCKNGQMSCKQCMTAKDYSRSQLGPRINEYLDVKKPETVNKVTELNDLDDALNIRIKIDVQLPKIYEKSKNYFDLDNQSNTKNFPLAMRTPTSYYNFPIPMNLFGYKRISKLNASPLHKLTIHKKKKTKSNTGGKKHRKKIITFHNIKLEPQQIYEAHFGKPNVNENTINDSTVADLVSSTTEILETNFSSTFSTHLPKTINETQTEENIFLLVNISNNVVNDTEESNKTNNSIESDYTSTILNATTENSLHAIYKREAVTLSANATVIVAVANKNVAVEKKVAKINTLISQEKHVINCTKALKDSTKKVDKLISEYELLFWPKNNGSESKQVLNNITAIILERETKKAKLNMTKETMRQNHTRALEKAIFGNVDWNDVDAVAPAFMSFIGKYMEGTLTFCSDTICHSMQCGQKVCRHRVCAPINRFNNKGHCIGANNTDSVATMESIMDLPSNVALEIVDILQDKMAGKLFGKVTLCISSKCITFVASKKMFFKNKCIIKDLNSKGHCVNSKEGKVT